MVVVGHQKPRRAEYGASEAAIQSGQPLLAAVVETQSVLAGFRVPSRGGGGYASPHAVQCGGRRGFMELCAVDVEQRVVVA